MRCERSEVTHVLRLLLAPDELRLTVRVESRRDLIGRERPELLDANEGNLLFELPLGARLQELVVDLARAEDDAACALDSVVRNDRAEGRAGPELGKRGHTGLVA